MTTPAKFLALAMAADYFTTYVGLAVLGRNIAERNSLIRTLGPIGHAALLIAIFPGMSYIRAPKRREPAQMGAGFGFLFAACNNYLQIALAILQATGG